MTVEFDYERVVDGLERCYKYKTETSSGWVCEECPYNKENGLGPCSALLLKEAFELLKEQEAKPVIVTTNAYGTRFYHCPRCNHDLYIYPRQLYCSNCGQAVKWGDLSGEGHQRVGVPLKRTQYWKDML